MERCGGGEEEEGGEDGGGYAGGEGVAGKAELDGEADAEAESGLWGSVQEERGGVDCDVDGVARREVVASVAEKQESAASHHCPSRAEDDAEKTKEALHCTTTSWHYCEIVY